MPGADATGQTRANFNNHWLHQTYGGLSPTRSQRALLGPLIFEVGETTFTKPLPPLSSSSPVSWVVPDTDSGNYPVPVAPRPRTVVGGARRAVQGDARRPNIDRLKEASRPRAGLSHSSSQHMNSMHGLQSLSRSVSWSELKRQSSTGSRSTGSLFAFMPPARNEITGSTIVAKQMAAPLLWATARPSPRVDEALKMARCATPTQEEKLRAELEKKKVSTSR